jgi:hypothetical protein
MPHGLTTPIDISPAATGVWASVDITSYSAPHEGNVAGVVLFVVNTDPIVPREFGVRKNGSTDTYKQNMWIENAHYHYVGVDENHLLRIYIEHATVEVYLIGLYTYDEAVFFANPIDKSIVTPGSWQTISVASEVGTDNAVLAFLRINSGTGGQDHVGVRPIGSTDSDVAFLAFAHGVVVALDSAKEFQVWLDDELFPIELLGYQKVGATMQTNKVDYSTAKVDAWETVAYSDLDVPDEATGVYFHLTNNSTVFQRRGAHRALGSGFDKWYFLDKQSWGWSPVSSAGHGEQKINNTEMNLYLLGWTADSPTSKLPYQGRSIHGGAQNFNGGLL